MAEIDQKLKTNQAILFQKQMPTQKPEANKRKSVEEEFSEDQIKHLSAEHQEEAKAIYKSLKESDDNIKQSWKAAQEAKDLHEKELERRKAWLHECLKASQPTPQNTPAADEASGQAAEQAAKKAKRDEDVVKEDAHMQSEKQSGKEDDQDDFLSGQETAPEADDDPEKTSWRTQAKVRKPALKSKATDEARRARVSAACEAEIRRQSKALEAKGSAEL